DCVEHQPLARVEADPQGPLLPLNFLPRDGEARTLWLPDLQRLEVGARLLEVVPRPVAGLGRQGDDSIILDPEDFLAVEAHDGDDSLQGARVAVVARLGADPA